MFGANDNTQMSNDDPAMLDNVKQLASEPADTVSTSPPQFMTSSTPQQPISQFTPTPVTSSDPNSAQALQQSPTMPQNDFTQPDGAADNSNQEQTQEHSSIAEPAQGFSSVPIPDEPAPDDSSSSNDTADVDANQNQDTPIAATPMSFSAPVDPQHLAGMKQQALDHLEPLVDHLDQSAEESFKTTMMMIQANDNHTLLDKALEQAKKIEDDKVRANAMLDIINEINYFSQANQE
jgi:hypothetical protein